MFFRLPILDESEQARRSIAHAGHENQMRRELMAAASALMDRAFPKPRERSDDEVDRLIALSRLVVRCRSAVERDGYTREIELVGEPEAPTRLIVVLSRLLDGIEAIGCSTETAWGIVTKIALDSMPQLRRSILELLQPQDQLTTSQLAVALNYPTQTTRRGLEDLNAYGLISKEDQGQGKASLWSLSGWTRERLSEMDLTLSRFVYYSGFGLEDSAMSLLDLSGNGSESAVIKGKAGVTGVSRDFGEAEIDRFDENLGTLEEQFEYGDEGGEFPF